MDKISIHGKYYDLREFKHPGGQEILELCKGEPDCSALFESYHAFCNMNKIKKIMKQYEVKVSDKKCLFSFSENGFYNTCKHRVRQHFNRQNSKADIDWGFTVLFSLLLFLYCQYICLYSDNYSIVKIFYSILSGITLLSLGYNVLHYTLELGEEYVGLRYDSIFSGVTTANIKYYKDDVKSKISKLPLPRNKSKTSTICFSSETDNVLTSLSAISKRSKESISSLSPQAKTPCSSKN